MEGSPINGNVIHAYEFATVTTNHELLEGVPGGVDLKPSDIQLLHTESEAILNSIPDRESFIREWTWHGAETLTYEEAASGI